MTIKWSFSCNSFVKFHRKNLEPQYYHILSKSGETRCVIKGLN